MGTARPGAGSNHGFSVTLGDVSPGPHTIIADGINEGPGEIVLLGRANVMVPATSG